MKNRTGQIENFFEQFVQQNEQARKKLHHTLMPKEIGKIFSVNMGVATISGLSGIGASELVKFPGNLFGLAFNLDEDEVGVYLLDDYTALMAGDEVERTNRVMDIGVGEGLLGRVVDPLGRPLDGRGQIKVSSRLPIERQAPGIMDRLPVQEPLQTGIKTIDALVPIGKGQRELILGDRQTGKTTVAINTIINQRDKDVVCVYCAIGQRSSAVAQVINTLEEHHAMDHTIIVITEGNQPPGLKFIAPYSATSMAEYFMEQGKDVLIVYDDLTHHARAYRELSLLLRRPPGREAYPGDIFYIHSRLLERATHLNENKGGGSLTALPIIEIEEENISSYIPTNLISITDGQVYLSPTLFSLGVLPAIDVGKSVSRVGNRAQLPIYQEIAGSLKLNYAQFQEVESFARFGARIGEETKKIIHHGKRIRASLKQKEIETISVPAQLLILLALTYHIFDDIALNQIENATKKLTHASLQIPEAIIEKFYTSEKLDENTLTSLIELIKKNLADYFPQDTYDE